MENDIGSTVKRVAGNFIDGNFITNVSYNDFDKKWLIYFYQNKADYNIAYHIKDKNLPVLINKLLVHPHINVLRGVIFMIEDLTRRSSLHPNISEFFIPKLIKLLKERNEMWLLNASLQTLGNIGTNEATKALKEFRKETKNPFLKSKIDSILKFQSLTESMETLESLAGLTIVDATEDLKESSIKLQELIKIEELEPIKEELGNFQQELENLSNKLKEFESNLKTTKLDVKNIIDGIRTIPHLQTTFRGEDFQRQIDDINIKLVPLEKIVNEDDFSKQKKKDKRTKWLTIWGIFATIVSLILGIISILVKKGIL